MASDTSLHQVPLLTLRRVDWPPCCRCCVRVGTLVAFFVAGICYIWSSASAQTQWLDKTPSTRSVAFGPVQRQCYIWSCASAQWQWLRRFPDRKDSFEEPYTLGDTSVLRIMTSGLILISEGCSLNFPSAGPHWLPCVGLHLEDDGAWQGSQETHLNLSIMEYISPPSWTHMLVSSIYAKFY